MITNVKKPSLNQACMQTQSTKLRPGVCRFEATPLFLARRISFRRHGLRTYALMSSTSNDSKMAKPRKLKLCAEALGRRKNASCHVRMYAGLGHIYVNGKCAYDYFQNQTSLLQIVLKPVLIIAQAKDFTFDVRVSGGGLVSQAYAVQLALSRAYIKSKPVYRGLLKQAGLLTRDPREKERKKYGLKKARKAPQFSKR